MSYYKVDSSKLSQHISGSGVGLTYHRSHRGVDLDANTIAPWDSFVWGIKEGDFVKVGQLFLPTHLHDEPVLTLVDEDDFDMMGLCRYKVDGSKTLRNASCFSCLVSSSAKGLGYCRSPNIADTDITAIAPWGSFVWGIKDGDFVKVGHQYLPTHSNGTPILIQDGSTMTRGLPACLNDEAALGQDGKKAEAKKEEGGMVAALSILHKEFAVARSESQRTKEVIGMQLTNQQAQLQEFSTRMATAMKSIEEFEGRLQKLGGLVVLCRDFEGRLSAHESSMAELLESKQVAADMEAHLASYESRLDELAGIESIVEGIQARLSVHDSRLDKLTCANSVEGQPVELQDVETRVLIQHLKEDFTNDRSERIKQYSDMVGLKAQMMPKLQYCEAELARTRDALTKQDALTRQVSLNNHQTLANLEAATERMDDLESRLKSLGGLVILCKDFEARLSAHENSFAERQFSQTVADRPEVVVAVSEPYSPHPINNQVGSGSFRGSVSSYQPSDPGARAWHDLELRMTLTESRLESVFQDMESRLFNRLDSIITLKHANGEENVAEHVGMEARLLQLNEKIAKFAEVVGLQENFQAKLGFQDVDLLRAFQSSPKAGQRRSQSHSVTNLKAVPKSMVISPEGIKDSEGRLICQISDAGSQISLPRRPLTGVLCGGGEGSMSRGRSRMLDSHSPGPVARRYSAAAEFAVHASPTAASASGIPDSPRRPVSPGINAAVRIQQRSFEGASARAKSPSLQIMAPDIGPSPEKRITSQPTRVGSTRLAWQQ